MASHVTLDETVQGKRVINADGDEIGVISGVRNDTAFVDPNPGLTDKVRTVLGWDDVDEDDYPLPEEAIERIHGDEVHLRSEF